MAVLDPTTNRPVWTGPLGEAGYGGPQPGAVEWQGPNGPTWYYPGQNIQAGNVQALAAWRASLAVGGGATGVSTSEDAAKAASQNDTLAAVKQALGAYFDPATAASLSQWAWDEIQKGNSAAQVMLDLRQRPEFKQRFPGMDARQQQGLPAISPDQYLQTEEAYKTTLRQYGLPVTNNPGDYVSMFANDISGSEFDQRVQNYWKLQNVYAPHIKEMFEQFAGITNISDTDLYKMMSGQDPSLGAKYAQATGTDPNQQLTFDALKRAEQNHATVLGTLPGGGLITTYPALNPEGRTAWGTAAPATTTVPAWMQQEIDRIGPNSPFSGNPALQAARDEGHHGGKGHGGGQETPPTPTPPPTPIPPPGLSFAEEQEWVRKAIEGQKALFSGGGDIKEQQANI